jgi:hypothetical protein
MQAHIPAEVRFLEAAAEHEVHDDPLVQVWQVGWQAVQLMAPESKNPAMHLQFWVMSLRMALTHEVQAPLGELQVWH